MGGVSLAAQRRAVHTDDAVEWRDQARFAQRERAAARDVQGFRGMRRTDRAGRVERIGQHDRRRAALVEGDLHPVGRQPDRVPGPDNHPAAGAFLTLRLRVVQERHRALNDRRRVVLAVRGGRSLGVWLTVDGQPLPWSTPRSDSQYIPTTIVDGSVTFLDDSKAQRQESAGRWVIVRPGDSVWLAPDWMQIAFYKRGASSIVLTYPLYAPGAIGPSHPAETLYVTRGGALTLRETGLVWPLDSIIRVYCTPLSC